MERKNYLSKKERKKMKQNCVKGRLKKEKWKHGLKKEIILEWKRKIKLGKTCNRKKKKDGKKNEKSIKERIIKE